MVRRIAVLLATILGATTLATLAPASADAGGPYCGLRWGSVGAAAGDLSAAHLTDVRSGRHGCFDRLVLDFDGDMDGYRVRYVSKVRADGSGHVVPVRGGARLQVIAKAAAYDDDGDLTYAFSNRRELVDVTGYRTFRQVRWAGSYEGVTTLALGVRARLPFRVFTVDGPGSESRLVIDVAHRW